MDYIAPSALLRELDRQLKRIIAMIDVHGAERTERLALETIRQQLAFAKKRINDYELGDSREEQQEFAGQAIEDLEKLHAAILKASEYNFFGAVDVADTTAQIERIVTVLRR